MKTLLSTHLTGGRISSIDPYSHTVERNTLGYINPIKTSDGEDGVHPFHGVGDQVLRWNSRDEISQGGFSHKGLLPPARTQDHPHRPSIRTQSKTLPLGGYTQVYQLHSGPTGKPHSSILGGQQYSPGGLDQGQRS